MIKAYKPFVHTGEARREQLGRIVESYPDVVIIGSVGRAAITGEDLPVRKALGLVRDIDVTDLTGEPVILGTDADNPFPVDGVFTGAIRLDDRGGSAVVGLRPLSLGLCVEMDPKLFEPFEAEFEGVRLRTFQPDTLRNLFRLAAIPRHKDRLNLQRFEHTLQTTGVSYTPIPDIYFSPLDELEAMAANAHSAQAEAQLASNLAMVDA